MFIYGLFAKSPAIPKLDLNESNIANLSMNDVRLSAKVGINNLVGQKIALGLHELQEKKIFKEGMLTVLEVNLAGEILHNACLNGTYNGILKPIFIKHKSIKESIFSPFLAPLSQKDKDKNNHALTDYELGETNLTYPLAHLKKLRALGYVTLLEPPQKGWLKIQETKSGKFFQVKLPSNTSKSKPNQLFKGSYFKTHKNNLVTIYNEDKTQKFQVLGVRNKKSQARFLPIIADIDAHNFGIKKGNDSITYNTKNDEERGLLYNAVSQILQNSMQQDEIKEYLNAISPHMGKLTAYEFIAYYAINKACGRTDSLKLVFQHGATANMAQSDADAIRKDNPESSFPAITDTTQIAAFSSISTQNLLTIRGAYIPLLYDILNKEGEYHFKLQPLWAKQLANLPQDELEQHKQSIRDELERIGFKLKQPQLESKPEPSYCIVL